MLGKEDESLQEFTSRVEPLKRSADNYRDFYNLLRTFFPDEESQQIHGRALSLKSDNEGYVLDGLVIDVEKMRTNMDVTLSVFLGPDNFSKVGERYLPSPETVTPEDLDKFGKDQLFKAIQVAFMNNEEDLRKLITPVKSVLSIQ